MRRELKKRNVKHLKVVYSKEKPVRPIEDMGISCRTNCICPPGAAHKCTELEICYSIGLAVGIIVFFNHVGHKKITHDPTPIQIEMRKYETDLDTAFINNAERRGHSVDVD